MRLKTTPTKIIPRLTVAKYTASSFGFITFRRSNASGNESAVTLITCRISVKLGLANLLSEIPAPTAKSDPIAAYAPAKLNPTPAAKKLLT